jgi:hypothetical protein
MNNALIPNEQLELGFNGVRPVARRRQTRLERAAWWFARMRAAVDAARRDPAPVPPCQLWMPQPQARFGA